jgi:ubiquinone/menaquinone biosynthesis C-methylase UbiE
MTSPARQGHVGANERNAWSIRDLGELRAVRGGGVEILTPLSASCIEELAGFRPGVDLIDELLRSEHAPYIHERLAVLLAALDPRPTWSVLDYGCGAGASSVVLARLGVGRIVGVDAVNAYAHVWRRRLEECGFPGIGEFVAASDPLRLPFAGDTFDAVVLNGVLEHLLPEERPLVLAEALRLAKRAGFVVVSETPNRLFPRHSHTKLWFSELLPDWMAAPYAAALGLRRDFPRRGRTAQYRTGYRGLSLRQIREALGARGSILPCNESVARMEFTLPRNPLEASAARVRIGRTLWPLIGLLAGLFRTSPCNLAPHLNLVIQKR